MNIFKKKAIKTKVTMSDVNGFIVRDGLNNTFDIDLKPEGIMQFFEWLHKSPKNITIRVNGQEYTFGETVDKLLFILGFDLAIQVLKDPEQKS